MKPQIEVIAVISNPVGYKSRYELYRKFHDTLKHQTIPYRLWTAELQHGNRPMRITEKENETHVQLWTSGLPGLVWYKENLQNLLINQVISKFPDSARYFAFIDADFLFEPDALEKTIDALQHYDVVQMWSHLINLCPKGGIINSGVGHSFMYAYQNGLVKKNSSEYEAGYGSPGGAWAFRRESLNKLGSALGSPFIDWNIVGGGDRSMALALIDKVKCNISPEYSKGYIDSMVQWQDNAVSQLKKNIGFVHNTVRHMYHGRERDRGYDWRWRILADYKFNPITDLKRDVSGIWHLVVHSERQIAMRDACRAYFFSRNEDANTL